MGRVSVGQIIVTQLKHVPLPYGDVMHGMRRDDPGFVDFGEAYFSRINQGAIKAWKRHLRMTLNFVVPEGTVKFVFIDNTGAIRVEMVGPNRYVRLTIPPGIWFGLKGMAAPYSLLLNLADIPHEPDDIERKSIDGLIFDWGELP